MADMLNRLGRTLDQYHGQIESITEVGKTLIVVSEALLVIQASLADGQLTPAEIRDISQRIAKLQPLLQAAQRRLQ